eukprot:4426035-Pyramimonas_sp.AAC.1
MTESRGCGRPQFSTRPPWRTSAAPAPEIRWGVWAPLASAAAPTARTALQNCIARRSASRGRGLRALMLGDRDDATGS